jgi:serine phosphatase RsbU (regulator of sigma subunit)/tetratricopeptide (TPR) repeat protein
MLLRILIVLFLLSGSNYSFARQNNAAEAASALAEEAWVLRSTELEKAVLLIDSALVIAEKENLPQLQAKFQNYRGIMFRNLGGYNAALAAYYKALRLSEKHGPIVEQAYANNNISEIFARQNDLDKAREYLEVALRLFQEANNEKGLAYAYVRLGDIEIKAENYIKALELYSRSVALREQPGSEQQLVTSLQRLGDVYLAYEDYNSARQYYQNSLELAHTIGKVSIPSMSVHYSVGKLAEAEGNRPLAIENGLKAYEIATEIGSLDFIAKSSKLLAESYKELGKLAEAYKFMRLHNESKTTVLTEQNQRELDLLEMRNRLDQQELENSALQNEQTLSAERLKAQKRYNFLAVLATTLLLVLSAMLVYALLSLKRSNKVLRRRHKQLKHNQEKAEKQANNLQKANKLISSQADALIQTKAQLQLQHDDLMSSINYAKSIQELLLPSAEKLNELLPEHFVLYQPRNVVSGDFYWVHQTTDYLFVVVADCTGHGVPGAILSIIGFEELEKLVKYGELTDPAAILTALDIGIKKVLKQETEYNNDGMDLALLRVDRAKNELAFAGARLPLVLIKENKVEIFSGKRESLGGEVKREKSFTTKLHTFTSPCSLYLYSDGFQDQLGGWNNKKFMAPRFRDLLLRTSNLPLQEQKEKIAEELHNWIAVANEQQVDDILVFGIRL